MAVDLVGIIEDIHVMVEVTIMILLAVIIEEDPIHLEVHLLEILLLEDHQVILTLVVSKEAEVPPVVVELAEVFKESKCTDI